MLANEEGFFNGQVPLEFKNANLDNCDLQPPEYIEFGKKWAFNPGLILLCGKYGRGKTHYAFALIREVFRRCPRHIWPRYFTSKSLDSRLLRASKSDEGDEFDVKDISEQDLLFIDDLGRETPSERTKRQYFEIINNRHVNRLPTIITTNLDLQGIGDIFDGAIASRMQQWDIVQFNGPDIRGLLRMPLIRTET